MDIVSGSRLFSERKAQRQTCFPRDSAAPATGGWGTQALSSSSIPPPSQVSHRTSLMASPHAHAQLPLILSSASQLPWPSRPVFLALSPLCTAPHPHPHPQPRGSPRPEHSFQGPWGLSVGWAQDPSVLDPLAPPTNKEGPALPPRHFCPPQKAELSGGEWRAVGIWPWASSLRLPVSSVPSRQNDSLTEQQEDDRT